MLVINAVFAAIGLFAASIFDIRSREIPDWLNFSMLTFGLGASLIFSISLSNYFIILFSVIGAAVGWLLGYLFYKANQWGGGDAKALIAIGSLMGFNFQSSFPLFITFVINILVVGAFIGFFFTFVYAVHDRKMFRKNFKKLLTTKKILRIRRVIIIVCFILLVSAIFVKNPLSFFFVVFSATIFFLFYFVMYTRVVEKTSMHKTIPMSKLTEGDWVLQDVKYGKRVLCKTKDCINKRQLELLQKYKKNSSVVIKLGMPFLPSFFIAFILTLLFRNWFFLLF